MTCSQTETTPEIRNLVASITSPVTPQGLMELKYLMCSKLEIRDYNESAKAHERAIRWRRTADEILKDGYVYDGKACTDLVVVFIACARLWDWKQIL